MASDVLNEVEMHEEQRFSLFLTFSDASEQDRLFANLSNGGKVLMPIQNGFGMLRDRFEVQWMLAYEELVS